MLDDHPRHKRQKPALGRNPVNYSDSTRVALSVEPLSQGERLVLASDGYVARRIGVHSLEKLHYLERYCDIFNTGMAQKWPKRAFIELFSGPGMCIVNGTDQEVDGSPLIAAGCRTGFTDLFLNDLDDEGVILGALQARMAAAGAQDRARYYKLDCNAAVEPITKALDQLGSGLLTFAFIDPTNWQMRFESLARLTEGRRMDLLIVFHSGHMKRCVQVPPLELALFFGDDPADPEWLRQYRDAKLRGKSGTAALLDHYQARLRSLGYQAFDDRVTVEVANHGVPLYQMLFATVSPRGSDFWAKVSNKQSWGQLRFC